jgi:hypothetical protein
MSLDLSKDHALKKIMDNLNWSGEDTNIFYLLYIWWYFSKYRYCSKSSVQFAPQRKNNIAQLLENANTTPHQGSGECFFIKDYDFIHTRNLRFPNFKRMFFQQLNMKISQEPLNWRRVRR